MKILKPAEWDVLVCIEDLWLRKEQIPAVTAIATKTGLDQVAVVDALSNPLLQKSLEARGIPTYTDLDDSLNAKQIACINLIMNVSDRRSEAAKLRALGIPPATFYGWKRQKPFSDALRTQGEKLFGDTQSQVHVALAKAAMDGDVNAIKYYNQVSGRFDTARTVEQLNVKFVMQKLLETIQTHVHDPVVLMAIAEDFATLIEPQRQITQ